ncbi:MAG TPA: MBL fold metallo-hydrolase [Vicinamibacterales bacterium]|jgi:ribonuclease BN (tRNA processing enzyme)|nr:MBL fold metallo-hydrolase [Vicinamibacterales bacterium]
MSPSRREFVAALAGSLAAVPTLQTPIPLPQPPSPRAAPPKSGTRLILLGTGGGPSPKRRRSAPAQAIVLGDRSYIVDCGDGVARQLALAGVPLPSIGAVFVTHQHSDHNADYGNLLMFAWVAGLTAPIDTYGPPPLEKMTRLFLEMNAYDLEIRQKDEGRPAMAPFIRAHELTRDGVVMDDGRVKVTAALNEHPPVVPSFAYRFDAADRSIVISGDTNVSQNLIRLAAGADILVHEVMHVPSISRILERQPDAARLREHLIASHTTVEDVGRVAAAANVKTLVLSHFVPGDIEIPDNDWTAGARAHFKGRVIVGTDLMEI